MARNKNGISAPVETASLPVTSIKSAQNTAANQMVAASKFLPADVSYDRELMVDRTIMHYGHAAEEWLQTGRCLLIIKEHEPHGDFLRIVEERIGMNYRTAAQAMQAAVRFLGPTLGGPNMQAPAHLGKTKLVELLTLDDDELKELTDGGSIAGMTLDKIERMSTRELRAEVRKLKNKIEQDGKRTQERETAIDAVSAELADVRRSLKRRKPDETGKNMLIDITDWMIELRALGTQVGDGLITLLEHGAEHDLDYRGDVAAKANDAANVLLEILNQARMAGVEEPWQRIADLVGEG